MISKSAAFCLVVSLIAIPPLAKVSNAQVYGGPVVPYDKQVCDYSNSGKNWKLKCVQQPLSSPKSLAWGLGLDPCYVRWFPVCALNESGKLKESSSCEPGLSSRPPAADGCLRETILFIFGKKLLYDGASLLSWGYSSRLSCEESIDKTINCSQRFEKLKADLGEPPLEVATWYECQSPPDMNSEPPAQPTPRPPSEPAPA